MNFGIENGSENFDIRHGPRLDPPPHPQSCLSITLLLLCQLLLRLLLHGRGLRPLAQLGVNVPHYLVVCGHTKALLLLPSCRSLVGHGEALKLVHHGGCCGGDGSCHLLWLGSTVGKLVPLLQLLLGVHLLLSKLLLRMLLMLHVMLLLLKELTLVLLELHSKAVLFGLAVGLVLRLLLTHLLLLLLLMADKLLLLLVDHLLLLLIDKLLLLI